MEHIRRMSTLILLGIVIVICTALTVHLSLRGQLSSVENVSSVILDDGDKNFTIIGNNWKPLTASTSVGRDYYVNESYTIPAIARWVFNPVLPGTYEVFTTWKHFPSSSESVLYGIASRHGILKVTTIDQRNAPSTTTEAGSTWQSLGTVEVQPFLAQNGKELSNHLMIAAKSGGLNQRIVADAVWIKRVDGKVDRQLKIVQQPLPNRSASAGELNVPVAKFSVTSDSVGPLTLNRILVQSTTGSIDDVARFNVWTDTGNNGSFETKLDTTNQMYVDRNMAWVNIRSSQFTVEGTKPLLITADIKPNAASYRLVFEVGLPQFEYISAMDANRRLLTGLRTNGKCTSMPCEVEVNTVRAHVIPIAQHYAARECTGSVIQTYALHVSTGTCGDGKIQPGEQCDDGNRNDTDACTNSCKNKQQPAAVLPCSEGKPIASQISNLQPKSKDVAGIFYPPATMIKPSYLSPVVDPTFGSVITRITGDPGSFLTNKTNTGERKDTVWTNYVKNLYVHDSAWNINGTLLQIIDWYGPHRYLLLDGRTYQPCAQVIPPASVFPAGRTNQFLWSRNPATPNIQYLFPNWRSPDPKTIHVYDVTNGRTIRTITNLPFDFNDVGGKGTIAFVDGKEYTVLMGRRAERKADGTVVPGQEAWMYLMNLTTGERVGQATIVNNDQCGMLNQNTGEPDPAACKRFFIDSMRFDPTAKYLLVAYQGSDAEDEEAGAEGGASRLLDVNIHAQSNEYAITPRAIPAFTSGRVRSLYHDFSKGFLPENLKHPMFALGNDKTTVYLVGGSMNWARYPIPEVELTNEEGRVGKMIAYNVAENRWRSLTDPESNIPGAGYGTGKYNEASVSHISATNILNPGYVYVSYGTESENSQNGPMVKYTSEIVAINVDDPKGPNGFIRLAHHRTMHNSINTGCAHNCQAHITVSPDGTRLLFPSTWGTTGAPDMQCVVRP